MDYRPIPFRVRAAQGGKSLLLEGDFDGFVRRRKSVLRHTAAEELIFACNRWTRLDLGFLAEFGRLKKLRIATAYDEVSLPSLASLRSLRALALSQACRFEVKDWENLRLKELSFSALGLGRSRIAALTAQRELEVLFVAGLTVPDMTVLRGMNRLRRLRLNGRIPSSRGLETLTALREAELRVRLKTLAADLAPLRQLRRLNLDWNPGLRDLSHLSDLRLTTLSLWDRDLRPVKSLAPIGRIATLRRFALDGGVDDGDLTPLVNRRALQECVLGGEKYYRLKMALLPSRATRRWELV